jgi:hypothetical protein
MFAVYLGAVDEDASVKMGGGRGGRVARWRKMGGENKKRTEEKGW